MPKIGVLLSGCGVFDGAEIHESVLTLLELARHKAEAVCLAPDMEQTEVINHLTGKPAAEKRNVLVEAARIARGHITDIKQVKAADLDALILPGGYGAVKNLSSFAKDGAACQVHPEVERLVTEMSAAGKPIGAICIAPAVIAKILKGRQVSLTIGSDKATAGEIGKLGQKHVVCTVGGTCVDDQQQVVSTPAYMLAKDILEAHSGIEKLVAQIMDRVRRSS